MEMLWLAKHQHQQWLLPRLLQPFCRLLRCRSFSDAASPTQKPPPPPESAHFMVDYLVSSCGLSGAEALKASKHLTHLKSPAKPDAVLRLLKQTGFRDEHIRRLVRLAPTILVADAKKTLEPKIMALQQQAGFSKPDLVELISTSPPAIRLRDAVSKLEFWRKLLGDNAKVLKLAKNVHLLGCNLDGKINANVSFLRSQGLLDADIAKIFLRRRWSATRSLDKLMSVVDRVKSFGIAPGSGVFVEALCTVCDCSPTTLDARTKVLKSLGWSADELLPAFQSFPTLFRFSKKKITRALDFLVKEAGYEHSYVTRRPVLLGYSMDRRLIPRCHVLQFLKKKRLPGGDRDLLSVMTMTDKKFVERFIAPFGEHLPELLEMYPEVTGMHGIHDFKMAWVAVSASSCEF